MNKAAATTDFHTVSPAHIYGFSNSLCGDRTGRHMRAAALAALCIILLASAASAQQAEKPVVYFVYADGCPACAALEPFINELARKYPAVEFAGYEFRANTTEISALYTAYNVPAEEWGRVPKVFVDGYYCSGATQCESELEDEIKKALSGGSNGNGNAQPIELSAGQLIGYALADAVNPCEMAVLVILLTAILVRFPEKRIKVLYAGLAFSLAIVLVYITMGLLIISGIKAAMGLSQFNLPLLYKALGVVSIIVGLLNVKDFVKLGAGGFATEVPKAWQPRMKAITGGVTSTKGAFVAGIIVSLFLTPCTMGPYFLAAGILAGVDWLTAVPWLVLYNAVFILPMVAITLAVYCGMVAIGEVAGWRERNIRLLHLVAGLIMVAIGLWLVFGNA